MFNQLLLTTKAPVVSLMICDATASVTTVPVLCVPGVTVLKLMGAK